MARITSKITISDRIETPSPMVGSNGNWWHYDTAQKKYVDSGKMAESSTEVGGRNLALNTSTSKRAKGTYTRVVLSEDLQPSTTYTLSFDVEVHTPPLGGKFLALFGYQTNVQKYASVDYMEGKMHYVVTTTTPNSSSGSQDYIRSVFIYPNSTYYSDSTPNVGEVTFSKIKIEKGNKATDWTEAPEDVEARTNALFTEARQATDALKNFTDGVFADGVITRAEAIAIARHKQQVNERWESAFANYEKVYANTLLSGTPKTDLLNTKVSLSGAKDALLSAITTAITDGKATTAEVTNVNNKYTVFNTALAAFEKALEVARDAIRLAGVDAERRAREEADRQNLQRANQAYEKAVRAERLDRLHPHYGVWSADITYPYNDNVAAVVEHNKVHYILKAICPKGTPPSTGSSSDPYWRYIDSFHLLYSKYVKAEVCEIGDMSLVNGEGSDDYIKFEKLDSDGSVHEYMQIGGEAKTESQLQASSTQGKYISISPQVFSTSGTHLVNKTKTESGNYIAKYTGTLELSAWASPMYVPPVAGGQGTYLPSEVSGDAKLIMTVKSASGTLKYTSTSTVLSVSASSDSGNGNGGTAPLIDYMPGGGDTKTLKFTLTAPADKISISDNIELKVELNRYGSTAPGNTIKASLYGVELYSVVDISKSKVTIAKDRISFFFGRSKYILMNYLEQWVLKIVGNALIQGNLEVSGELTAAHIATSGAVLCGGQVSSGGYVSNSFGKYKAQSSTNSNPRVDRLTSPNRFKVYHTINNTNYVPYITPVSVGYADMPQVVDKQSTYFIVQFYNGSGASHHFAFNYLCLKGD